MRTAVKHFINTHSPEPVVWAMWNKTSTRRCANTLRLLGDVRFTPRSLWNASPAMAAAQGRQPASGRARLLLEGTVLSPRDEIIDG